MMEELDKRSGIAERNFEFSEGERTLLSSNKGSTRSPSLDLGISDNSTPEELLNILADMLIEAFLWHNEHDKQHQKQQSSNLFSGINKRTS